MSCLCCCQTTQDLGNLEILKKSQIWVETWPSVQLPSRNRNLAIAVQKYRKSDIKVFWFFPVSLNTFAFFQMFCREL